MKVIQLQVGPGHLVNVSLRSKEIFIRSFHRKDPQSEYQTIRFPSNDIFSILKPIGQKNFLKFLVFTAILNLQELSISM